MPPVKENGAWLYSYAWTEVKQMPRKTVSANPRSSPLRSPSISEWCAQVTVVPDNSRISVLRNGNSNGLNGWTVLGGHTPPTGNRLDARNAQKKAAKNITSEAMNSAMP